MNAQQPGTLFGHPTGLFTLFFAEMWERFSFYGMRALLLFYMLKGFLGYGDRDAYAIYGAYTALVYMTPLFGGMLADRLLGARRAVVLGGLLMAGGHLMMSAESNVAFFLALALLIVGNGFFKPNISTMVGSLYPQGSPRRDAGFTIFYMGINLGAAMSPLLCGYIGETYGWHYGFGLATLGMLTGLAVFVAPVRITQVLIMSGALAAALGLFYFRPDNPFSTGVNIFVGIALLIAGVIAWVALGRGGLPDEVGAPSDPERLRKPVAGPISAEWSVYLLSLLAIPVLALLVSSNRDVTVIPSGAVESLKSSGNAILQVSADVLAQMSTPAGLILMLAGLLALVYLGRETLRLDKVPRERMYVVLILTFFSMLFWAFFEQAGSSLNNFTDRNVDRVAEERRLAAGDVGSTLTFRIPVRTGDPDLMRLPLLTQEQIGHRNPSPLMKQRIGEAIRIEEKRKGNLSEREVNQLVDSATREDRLTMSGLTYLRAAAGAPGGSVTFQWMVTPDNLDMAIGGSESPASVFQAVNPIYILLFGIAFSALWTFLGRIDLEPSTPLKFSLGLLQLGLGFGAFWYGAQSADERGMVVLFWVFLGYLLHTTGELCLSPVGLSMVTRLSPARLVSTVMGSWFLATAFSQFLAAIIAQFTGVTEGGYGEGLVPVPKETVHVYGDVFGTIALTAIGSAVVCLLLAPLLKRWMHEGAAEPVEQG
jgi:POT family proton-dependent oligopeptide transporter